MNANPSGYKVLMGPPGANFTWGCVRGLLALTGSRHEIKLVNSGNGFDDFDAIWCTALNEGEAGRITHVAMLHLDIVPATDDQPIWLDTLISEMDRLGLDYISAVSPIKDSRGLTSSGIGDPKDSWNPHKRFTMHEIHQLPETFAADDAGYDGWPLLHNSGCWVADMRKPLWYKTDAEGNAPAHFAFPERVRRDPTTGMWCHGRESEDWYFSRCMHAMGAKTAITRKVKLTHQGKAHYANFVPWGDWPVDLATLAKWNVPRGPWDDVPGWFDFADLYQDRVDAVNGKPAHFVEVGSWVGKSTVFLASKIRDSGKNIRLDCVDTWCAGVEHPLNGSTNKIVREAGGSVYPQFMENIERNGLVPFVHPIRSDSAEAAKLYEDNSLDFVFIDADHTKEAVLRDLAAYYPKVKPGGMLAGHDYDEEGVKSAVDEFTRERGIVSKQCGRSFVIEC